DGASDGDQPAAATEVSAGRAYAGWQLVGTRLGLASSFESGELGLHGVLDGLPVEVVGAGYDEGTPTTPFRVVVRHAPPLRFALRSAAPLDRTAIATGDPDFDESVVVQGDEITVLALLDAETRLRLVELILRVGALMIDTAGGVGVLACHAVAEPFDLEHQ